MAAQLLSRACGGFWDCFPDSTVALVNADGSGLRSIAGAGGFARPSWSPDGMRIAFGSSACPRPERHSLCDERRQSIGRAHLGCSQPGLASLHVRLRRSARPESQSKVPGCERRIAERWRVPSFSGSVMAATTSSGVSRPLATATRGLSRGPAASAWMSNGGSLDDGASIVQWQCHGGANQQWRLEVAGDGYSRIVSRTYTGGAWSAERY